METKEELFEELFTILDTPIDDLLNRQINRSHTTAAQRRLSEERRRELAEVLRAIIATLKEQVLEERFTELARTANGLVLLCQDPRFRYEDGDTSGEVDGLAQVVTGIIGLVDELSQVAG